MNDFHEKRRNERQNLVWNIYRHIGDTLQHLGYIKNFSISGLLFTSKAEIEVGESFNIKITVPEKLYLEIGQINLEVDVVIIRKEIIDHYIYKCDCGATFKNVSPKDEEMIEKFLEHWKNNYK